MKIISGGQTGADRAALDWAIAHRFEHGGWCPRGRKAEDGPIAPTYELQETESADYAVRTRKNVEDSDGTLIVNLGEVDGGTLKTLRIAEKLGKPVHVVQLGVWPLRFSKRAFGDLAHQTNVWMHKHRIRTLNVAGPRESKRPGIYKAAYRILSNAVPQPTSVICNEELERAYEKEHPLTEADLERLRTPPPRIEIKLPSWLSPPKGPKR